MRFEKILSVIFMSVVICFAAGFFGLFFNIVNPGGLSLIPKNILLEPSNIKAKMPVKPKPKPVIKAEVKPPVIVVPKPKPVVTVTTPVTVKKIEPVVVKPPVTEKHPVTKDSIVEEKVVKVDERKVDIKEAKRLLDEKKSVFVDARPEYTYIERHIKGAISLSASRFNYQYEKIKDTLNKDGHYVIYCSSETCHLSDIVADHLKENGFKNIKIFSAGWDSWIAADYPIEGVKVKTGGANNE